MSAFPFTRHGMREESWRRFEPVASYRILS